MRHHILLSLCAVYALWLSLFARQHLKFHRAIQANRLVWLVVDVLRALESP